MGASGSSRQSHLGNCGYFSPSMRMIMGAKAAVAAQITAPILAAVCCVCNVAMSTRPCKFAIEIWVCDEIYM